jgi:nucleoside-diphosphate-sugar epimerase
MRVFFTGGSGKAGKHVAPYLAEQGHHVTNADLVPLRHPAVADLHVDLTDAGETYSALAGLATFDELDLPAKPTCDAVVHFAAVPAILRTSDAATYATNVLSTYNVLEAATRLGVRKIVFASSETTYGVCFAQGERRPLYVPVDEDHPTVPEDSYAMSKVANEVTARSFQARTGADVYGLRINNVIEPHEYAEIFPPSSPTRRCGAATCPPTSTSATWPDGATLPGDRRAGLRGPQRRQRRHVRGCDDPGNPGPLLRRGGCASGHGP